MIFLFTNDRIFVNIILSKYIKRFKQYDERTI